MSQDNARQAGLTEHQWREAFAAKAINGAMLNVRMAVEIVMETLAAHSADARQAVLTEERLGELWHEIGHEEKGRIIRYARAVEREVLAAHSADARNGEAGYFVQTWDGRWIPQDKAFPVMEFPAEEVPAEDECRLTSELLDEAVEQVRVALVNGWGASYAANVLRKVLNSGGVK